MVSAVKQYRTNESERQLIFTGPVKHCMLLNTFKA